MTIPPADRDLPGLPQDDVGPVFSAPWQAQGLASAHTLHALEHAWEDAAKRTPHGQPMELLPHGRALARS
jgi:hypothetical protein